MTDDLTRRLDALGATEPPPPAEALVADLDARRLGRDPERRARVLRLPVLLPAAAVAAIVLGFVLLAFGGGSSSPGTIVIATASDASVQQAERSVPATGGLPLEEGDRVVTGPTGSVTVGDDTLGPNEEAVLRGGRLRRRRERLATRATTTTTTTPPATTTTAPAAPAAPAPSTTSTTPPATEVAPDQRTIPVVLDLVGRRRADGSVALVWSRYDGSAFGSYVVLREDREVVARRPSVDGRGAVDRSAPPTAVRYVVVVLDADRHPVGRSQVIRR